MMKKQQPPIGKGSVAARRLSKRQEVWGYEGIAARLARSRKEKQQADAGFSGLVLA